MVIGSFTYDGLSVAAKRVRRTATSIVARRTNVVDTWTSVKKSPTIQMILFKKNRKKARATTAIFESLLLRYEIKEVTKSASERTTTR
ncbi:MAG: hypothetical protein ACE5IJ_04680, partial [Thermoplasmata archaeon]